MIQAIDREDSLIPDTTDDPDAWMDEPTSDDPFPPIDPDDIPPVEQPVEPYDEDEVSLDETELEELPADADLVEDESEMDHNLPDSDGMPQ